MGFKSNFLHLAGIMSLSFFVHNFVLTVAKKANPKTVKRDVTIGFSLGGICYAIVGGIGYLAFGDKMSSFQNYLEVFPKSDWFAMSAKVALLLQLASLYPMVSGILRAQVFTLALGSERQYPGRVWALCYSLALLACGALFAIFYPKVGDAIRFTGAACGFVYVFLLPIAVEYLIKRKGKKDSLLFKIIHATLVLIGLGLIISQFI